MKTTRVLIVFICLILVKACSTNSVISSGNHELIDLLSTNSWSAKSRYPFDNPEGKVEFCHGNNRKTFEFYNNFKNFKYKQPGKGSYEVISIKKNIIELKMLKGQNDERILWNIIIESEKKWYWEVSGGDGNKWYRYRCDDVT